MASSKKVNIPRLLEQQFGIKSNAAACLLTHGHVAIDGHTVHPQWARGHWTEDQLRGRMMSVAGRGEFRILGSRIAPVFEQTVIEV